MKLETLNSMKERRSIRSFLPEQISREKLEKVLEAGIYAPTGMGMQSPKIVVVQDAKTIEMLSKWNAEIMGSEGDPFYGAPTVLIVFADTNRMTYIEDGSLVLGNLLLAAYAADLGACWIHRAREEFQTPKGKELMRKWGIPENYAGIGHCILGYPKGDLPKAKPRKEDYIIRV